MIRREIERTFRVAIQTLVTPWISAVLFIFVFGDVIGRRIDLIGGVEYITFVLPGILMMNVITSSFMQSSNNLYFQRFVRHIEEILVAPLSHLEMIIGSVVSAIARSVIVGIGIMVIALFFGALQLQNFWLFLFYIIAASLIFALIGMLVGLWANGFEQLNVLNTFVIMPFSFLGGIFYTIEMLPEKLQLIAQFNPLFYLIDGIRGGMIGVSEANVSVGLILIIGSIIVFGMLVWYLFKIGYKIRL